MNIVANVNRENFLFDLGMRHGRVRTWLLRLREVERKSTRLITMFLSTSRSSARVVLASSARAIWLQPHRLANTVTSGKFGAVCCFHRGMGTRVSHVIGAALGDGHKTVRFRHRALNGHWRRNGWRR